MIITFKIDSEPKGKARPRFNSQSKSVYTPATTAQYERMVKTEYKLQGGRYLEGQITATIDCYFVPAKSTTKSKLAQMLDNVTRPTKKPDLDNIAKIILDSLNGVAYKDDSQIVSLTINKYYNSKAFVVVELSDDT